MSLPLDDLRHLMAAEGYVELGMYEEADTELEEMSPLCRHLAQVLTLKLCVYAGLKKWQSMQRLARKMVWHYPEEVHWQIWWAAAARQTHSIELARQILVRALQTHPQDPRLHYELSCYETRLQHFKQATRHLAMAIALDRRFESISLNEEDLEPLWQELGEESET